MVAASTWLQIDEPTKRSRRYSTDTNHDIGNNISIQGMKRYTTRLTYQYRFGDYRNHYSTHLPGYMYLLDHSSTMLPARIHLIYLKGCFRKLFPVLIQKIWKIESLGMGLYKSISTGLYEAEISSFWVMHSPCFMLFL